MSSYLLSAFVLCLAANVGLAQSEETTVVKALTIQDVAKIVEDEGFHVAKMDADNETLMIKVDGLPAWLMVRDKGRILCGHFGVKGVPNVTLECVNSWNQKRWFTRAFMDKNNHPVLEFDLDVRYGVTPQGIGEHIRFFRKSIPEFMKHLTQGVPEAPKAMPMPSLIGTTWTGREDLEGFGELSVEFRADGVAIMTDTERTIQGTWRRDGKKIVITFANCVYAGQCEGTSLNGHALMVKNGELTGEPWSFRLTKQ